MSLTKGLALAGFMGTGKTTVGRLVSRATQTPFIDLDELVSEAAGCTVSDLFEREGEQGFRTRERAVVTALASGPPVVAALGGGTLHQHDNLAVLRQAFDLVALTAPYEELARRVGLGQGRPLWKQSRALYAQRAEGYRSADLVVDTEDRSVQQVADQIVAWVACESR